MAALEEDTAFVPTAERVYFENAEGIKLCGVLNLRNESKDVVLLCHGVFCDKDTPVLQRLDERLPHNTLRLDFAGNGESGGQLKYSNYREEAEDVRAAVGYLRKCGFNVVGILGHSKGALSCLMYAEKYHDVPYMVSLAGRFYMERAPASRFTQEQMDQLATQGFTIWRVKDRELRLTQEMIDERARIDVGAIARQIPADVRVLVIHGTDDNTIPWDDSEALADALASSELFTLPGANHFFSREEQWGPMCDKVVSWLPAPRIHGAAK